MKRSVFAACLLLSLSLGGCQPRTAVEPQAEAAPPDWPPYDYAQAAQGGATVYRLDPARSRIDVLVGKSGPLARFGHEHVVSATGLEGFLLLRQGRTDLRGDLRFAVSALQVDAPDARARYGMQAGIDPEDIDGTRANLMGSVLDPGRWPYVSLSMTGAASGDPEILAELSIDLNGARHRTRASFNLQTTGTVVTVEGTLSLSHGELGLEPYSALGGGLRVADGMTAHFRLIGTPLR